jgi:AcrR family transcriptional regulator
MSGLYESMTKTDIIKAAFRVFGRELYQKTSLTQVASELGVTKPALYRHFKHKQELLDAMYVYFFDEYAAALKAGYDLALQTESRNECYLIVARSLMRYYCLNGDAFVFSLIHVYGNHQMNTQGEELARRGVDTQLLFLKFEKDTVYPSLIQLIVGTITFWVAHFHLRGVKCGEKFPAEQPALGQFPTREALVEQEIALMEQRLAVGLAFDAKKAALSFEALEERLAGSLPEDSEDDRLLRAVVGTVAEAGPWNASMDMVARRSGLSKSGLYAHFESKEEMVAQLFITEMDRITAYIEASRENSSLAEERLYLIIIAAANYLRSRPEFLVVMDWLRLRQPKMGSHTLPRLSRMFSGIDLECSKGMEAFHEEAGVPGEQTEQVAHWIFFLIINVLMWWKAEKPFPTPSIEKIAGVPNESFRQLYQFITLGMKGFDL